MTLGVGFGWNVEELQDHGVPGKKRRTVLREHLELMGELWSKDVASYDGEFAHVKPSLVLHRHRRAHRQDPVVGAHRQRRPVEQPLASIYPGPRGAAYMPTMAGLVRFKDG